MPTLRSEVIVVKHNKRTNNVHIPKTKKPAKKTTKKRAPRRNRANEEAVPDVVLVKPETLRAKVSHAPLPGVFIALIFVGGAGDFVTLHTDLLPRATQAYIQEQNRFNGFFALPSENPDIFKIYRNYLYTNKLYTISDEKDDHLNDEANATWEWNRLAHCYMLGKTIRDEKFANTCINAIVEKINIEDWYPTGIASDVYQYTAEGDKLRKLIVDLHVIKGEGQWIKAPHVDATEGPREFLKDVIDGMAPGIDADGSTEFLKGVIDGLAATEAMIVDGEEVAMPWMSNKCAYHTHDLTAVCE